MVDMFKGSDGEKVSMMRVSTFITTVSIIGTFIAHNVIVMIHGNGFVSMGLNEAGLLAATLGLKALQTKFENAGAPDTSTPAVPAAPTVADVPPDVKG